MAAFKPVKPTKIEEDGRTSPVFNKRNMFAKTCVDKLEIYNDEDVHNKTIENKNVSQIRNLSQFAVPVKTRLNPFAINSLKHNKISINDDDLGDSDTSFEGQLKTENSCEETILNENNTENNKTNCINVETPSKSFGKLSVNSPVVSSKKKSNSLVNMWWPQNKQYASQGKTNRSGDVISEDQLACSSTTASGTPATSPDSLWSVEGECSFTNVKTVSTESEEEDSGSEDAFVDLTAGGDSMMIGESLEDDFCGEVVDDDLVIVSCDTESADRRKAAKDWAFKTAQNLKTPPTANKKKAQIKSGGSRSGSAGNRASVRGCKRPGLSKKPSVDQCKQLSIKEALKKFSFNKQVQQLH